MPTNQTIHIPVGDMLAEGLLDLVRSKQDRFAREIFDLWFGGAAPAEVIREDADWAKYMLDCADLDWQINEGLSRVAEKRYSEFLRRYPGSTPSRMVEVFIENFHVEIGGAAGGYETGYGLLHGTNRNVGDFEVRGLVSIQRGSPAGNPSVSFSMLQMTFNDIMDPNFKYREDRNLEYIFRSIGRSKNGRVPRPYTLRIKWNDPKVRSFRLPIKRNFFDQYASRPQVRTRY